MLLKTLKIVLLFTSFSILLNSCQRRFWYREMVWTNSKNNVAVNLKIINENPAVLTKVFEEEMKATCTKQLLKKGYKVIDKKAPFHFNLVIKVQSFNVSGLAHYGGLVTTLHPYYNADVKAILFDCTMYQTKKDLEFKVWENNNDLYFFNKQKRDLRRSKSMVNYLIRSAKEKE